MMLPYPWHKALWDKVARVEALPHGILIHGRQGIGKLHFARCLAALLLCSRQDKFRGACGSCSGCHFMMQGVHPDYVEICPDEEEDGKKMSRLIKVEQIRDLGEMLSLTAHQNGCRVVLIHPAESLNISAANSLLKTLEEPNPGTYLILVAHHPGRLLPTILSRCAQVEMELPDRQEALGWLELQGLSQAENWLERARGAPLLALKLSEGEDESVRQILLEGLSKPLELNVIDLTEKIMQVERGKIFSWVYFWVMDLLNLLAIGQVRCHSDRREVLASLAGRAGRVELARFAQQITESLRTAEHPLNAQLSLEEMLLDYRALFANHPVS